MGEPASLTADERLYVAALADHIHDETVRDGATPVSALAQFANAQKQDPAWSLLAMAQEIRRLRGRVDELLAAIARVSQTTPFVDEIEGWQAQRAKLVAEIGTLRARVAELEETSGG